MSIVELANRVFNEDLLREMILENAILTSNNISTSMVQRCRLVNKAWLNSISKILRHSKNSLFKLVLNKDNSTHEAPFVKQYGKMLYQFVNRVTGPSRMEDRVPPFSIKATLDFFLEENFQDFSDCLARCGSELVALDVSIPEDGGSMPFLFHNISLPSLKTFSVTFSEKDTTDGDSSEGSGVGTNYHALYLIQNILNCASGLKNFTVPFTGCPELVPFSFHFLQLPTTITALELTCQMTNKNMEILTRNELSNLMDLSMLIAETAFSDGLIYNVLEKHSSTLKHLSLEGVKHDGTPRPKTRFKLPLMEKLTTLYVDSMHVELEDNLFSLDLMLPAISSVTLLDQTRPSLCRWTEGSKFESVRYFRASLADENFDCDDPDYPESFSCGMMRRVCTAFPSITHLDVVLSGSRVLGLSLVFLQMRQLERLVVRLVRSNYCYDSDAFDALLLGIPIEVAVAVRKHPEFCNNFDYGKSNTSIRRLTELHTLNLEDESSPVPLPPREESLISDVVFQFAFLQMDNLKKLFLRGRFMPSSKMVTEWTVPGRGRCISYSTELTAA